MPRLAANLSFLFTEDDFLDRFGAAAAAGFGGIEYLFPYGWPPHEIAARLREHRLEQVLFNLPAGNWDAGERGIASHPGREAEFREGLALAVDTARVLGCRQLNCLAGLRLPDVAEAEQLRVFAANLRDAAEVCGRAGIRLLVEPINSRVDMPGFLIDTPDKALACLCAAGHPNLALQFDIYHAQIMTGDLARQLAAHLPQIAHVQIADHPGRHEPGTGEINYPFLFAHLDRLGYTGWVGCEYRPLRDTRTGLAWAAEWLAPGGR